MRALITIRPLPEFRVGAFRSGLQELGYQVTDKPFTPTPEDVLITWNRYGHYNEIARRFESSGAKVIVAENGYLGREWRGSAWYAMSLNQHNGYGFWKGAHPNRWEELGIELKPWRETGEEIVVLAQRGIGSPLVRQPPGWVESVAIPYLKANTKRKIRVRVHPGKFKKGLPLEEDIKNAWAVVTWASGAGLKALVEGVPVFYGAEKWIGGPAGTFLLGADLEDPYLGDRRPMFYRLAWAMWELSEISSGKAFRSLLS